MKQTQKVNKCYTSELEAFDTYANPYNISKDDYTLIAKTFNNILMNEIIETGKAFSLPAGLGNLTILKKKPFDKAKFDYKLYKETGQKLWTKNMHSEGLVAVYI